MIPPTMPPKSDACYACFFPFSSFCLQAMQSRACGSASSRSKSISSPQLWHFPNCLGSAVEPAQRLVDVPEEAALLAREEERLLALHGVGALVGHVERIGREIAVGRLRRGVERLAVLAELLEHAAALIEQTLLEVRQQLLAHRLGALGAGGRRHLGHSGDGDVDGRTVELDGLHRVRGCRRRAADRDVAGQDFR